MAGGMKAANGNETAEQSPRETGRTDGPGATARQAAADRPAERPGKVYLVGAGPGGTGLQALRGAASQRVAGNVQ